MVGEFTIQKLANTTYQGFCFCFLRHSFLVTTAGKKKLIQYEAEDNMRVFLLIMLEVVEKAFHKIQIIFK